MFVKCFFVVAENKVSNYNFKNGIYLKLFTYNEILDVLEVFEFFFIV